jgi:DNA-binding XRE family transcriptional regulator
MSITPEQCRAARALLNWSQPTLAKAVGTTQKSITSFETGARKPRPNNLASIRATLEAAGIVFIDENGGGVGVRLRKRSR